MVPQPIRAYREWRVLAQPPAWQPLLQSTYKTTRWPDAVLTADIVPEPAGSAGLGSLHGIHAARAGCTSSYLPNQHATATDTCVRVRGVCDLWGVVQEHTDGVLRAEFCRVLALRACILPLVGSCPCGRVLIVSRPNQSHVPAGWAEFVRACAYLRAGQTICGQAPHLGETATVHGETTVGAIDAALRSWYEVGRLPDGDGPWQVTPPPVAVDWLDE